MEMDKIAKRMHAEWGESWGQIFKGQKEEAEPLEELEKKSCAVMETKTEFQVEGSIHCVNCYKDIKEDKNLTTS